MAHNEHEEFEDGFGPEDDFEEESSYGDEDEEGHHGHHEEDEESEYPEEDEEGEYEEEPKQESDAKSKLKKYAPFGIGAALLAGVGYLFFGHSSQPTAPQPRPALHASTAMTSQQPNAFQAQANHPVTVASNASLTPSGSANPNAIGASTPALPNSDSQNFHYPSQVPTGNGPQFNGNGNGFNHPLPSPYPGQGDNRFQGPPGIPSNGGINDENLSPEQRMSIENRANGNVFRAIAAMQKSIHEDIHKTSDDEKTAIIKRLDDMQKELEQKLKSDDSNGASNTQISGIRDMVSALKQSLDNANESLKSQQDTITSLRTELNAMKQKEADEQAQRDAEEAAKHTKGSKKVQKHQAQIGRAHV